MTCGSARCILAHASELMPPLPGVPVKVVFRESSFPNPLQLWLRSTTMPLQSITFETTEATSWLILYTVRTMPHMEFCTTSSSWLTAL